jgi:hypothetical protein
MTTLLLYSHRIRDATTSIAFEVWRDLDSASGPVFLKVDGDTLPLSLGLAERLAKAGERIERTLFLAKEPPKESSIVFALKIGLPPDGTVGAFELAVTADPLGATLVWSEKRLALGLDSIADLLFALSQVGEAVDDLKGVSRPAFDDARGAPQRPFQPPPPPGRRWETWTPKCWRDVGGPGW